MKTKREYSAIVTRYPTGVFGIAFARSMFWHTCWTEAEVHQKLAPLNLPARHVKWEERYYRNGVYRVPSDYMTRPYVPKKPLAKPREIG